MDHSYEFWLSKYAEAFCTKLFCLSKFRECYILILSTGILVHKRISCPLTHKLISDFVKMATKNGQFTVYVIFPSHLHERIHKRTKQEFKEDLLAENLHTTQPSRRNITNSHLVYPEPSDSCGVLLA